MTQEELTMVKTGAGEVAYVREPSLPTYVRHGAAKELE